MACVDEGSVKSNCIVVEVILEPLKSVTASGAVVPVIYLMSALLVSSRKAINSSLPLLGPEVSRLGR